MTFRARQAVVYRVLLPLVQLPRRVLALPVPLSSPSTVTVTSPLVVISLSLLFLAITFLSVKVLYMKHRRIGTIHSPPIAPTFSTSSDLSSPFRSPACPKSTGSEHRIDHGTWYRGLLVGCFGSPTWETNITTKLNGAPWPIEQRRKAAFAYHLHRNSKRRSARSGLAPLLTKSKNSPSSSRLTTSTSFFTFSGDAEEHISAASSAPSSQISNPSKTTRHPRRTRSHYGHFGNDNGNDTGGALGVTLPEGHASRTGRRVSPSSIRLVDGPGHSDPVSYSFLSGTPPKSVATSPLMGTRDSFQLSRCSLKGDRKPVPSLPPLPSFHPFSFLDHSEAPAFHPVHASEYLSFVHLSSLAEESSDTRLPDTNDGPSIVTRPLSVKRKLSRISNVNDTGPRASPFVQEPPAPHPIRDTNRTHKHKRSRSHRSLALEVMPLQSRVVVDENSGPLPPLSPVAENEAVQTTRTVSLRTSSSSRSSTISKRPLKPCLRQNSVTSTPSFCSPDSVPVKRFTFTSSISETSTRAYSQSTGQTTDDQASLQTPIPDIDIGLLGLDRFRWNDEIKELEVRSSHTKKDSLALVSFWEQDGCALGQKQHVNIDAF